MPCHVGAPDVPDAPDPVVDVPSDPVVVPVATQVSLTAPTAGATFGKSLTAAATAAPAPGPDGQARRVLARRHAHRPRHQRAVQDDLERAEPAPDGPAHAERPCDRLRRCGGFHGDHRVCTPPARRRSKAKSSRLSAAASAAQLSSEPAADGGTDLTGAARAADAVTATLAPCSGKGATKSIKLQAVGTQLSGHQRTGRLCVVGLSPSGS